MYSSQTTEMPVVASELIRLQYSRTVDQTIVDSVQIRVFRHLNF